MADTTTIQELPYPEASVDLVKGGATAIQALAEKLDAMLPRVGDIKPSYQQGDHTGWLICDGRTNLLRANYPTAFWNAMIGAGFAGDDGTRFGIPDLRGRVVVGKGTHADIDALTDNDGQAVGSRTPKHRHTPGSLVANKDTTFSPPDGENAGMYHRPGADQIARGDGSGNGADIGMSIGGVIGDHGPMEAPAYGVANFFVYAGV